MALIFGVPFFIFSFYTSLMSKGVPTDLPVAILDQDKTPLSRQLGMMLNQTATIDLAYSVNDELEGERLVRRNDVCVYHHPKRFPEKC